MKSNKELLELLLLHTNKRFSYFKSFNLGLCNIIITMCNDGIITNSENYQLKSLISSLPHPYYGKGYYWKPGRKLPRVRWIKKQLKTKQYESI